MLKNVALVAVGAIAGAYVMYNKLYRYVATIAIQNHNNGSDTHKSENT